MLDMIKGKSSCKKEAYNNVKEKPHSMDYSHRLNVKMKNL